jgi:hypothetical protein
MLMAGSVCAAMFQEFWRHQIPAKSGQISHLLMQQPLQLAVAAD